MINQSYALLLGGLLAVSLTGTVACTTKDDPPAGSAGATGAAGDPGVGTAGTATGSGGSDAVAGSSGSGGAATACNSVAIDAPEVGQVAGAAGPAPAVTGGEIVDGTYFLTKYEVFNGVDPKPTKYKAVMVITGGELQLAQILDQQPETRATFEVTLTGTKFAASSTCPVVGQTLAYDYYSATDTELVLHNDEKVVTLTLQ